MCLQTEKPLCEAPRVPKSSRPDRALTPKETLFVEAYIGSMDGLRSVKEAGYSVPNDRQGRTMAHAILAREPIKRALAEWKRKRIAKVHIDADRWLGEVAQIAFFDPAAVLNDDLSPKSSLEEIGPARRAIKKIKVRKESVGKDEERPPADIIEIEFHDKLSALDKVAKHLGLYAEDQAKERETDLLAEIRDRVGAAIKRGHPMPIGGAQARSGDPEPKIEDAEVLHEDEA